MTGTMNHWGGLHMNGGWDFAWTIRGFLQKGDGLLQMMNWWHIFRCSTTFWKLVDIFFYPVQVVHADMVGGAVGHGIWVQSRSGVFVSHGLSSQPYLAQLPFDYFWPIFSVGSSKPPVPKLANCAGKNSKSGASRTLPLGSSLVSS